MNKDVENATTEQTDTHKNSGGDSAIFCVYRCKV